MDCWLTFENRWEIDACLVAETGLRVGAGGEHAEPIETDLPVMKDASGAPFLPGSFTQGRHEKSYLERIVRTLEPRTLEPNTFEDGKGACDPTQESKWCVGKDQIRSWRTEARSIKKEDGKKDVDKWFAKQVWNNTCRVCRVFGSPWLASRVRIADLPAVGAFRLEIRDGVAINREKETVENKYDFETVTARFPFSTQNHCREFR